MFTVCTTKRPREIYDRFLNKKNDILRLSEWFQLSESTACCQKRRCDRIVALCILLKKRLSYPYRCKDVLPYLGEIQVCLIFAHNLIYQRHHHRLELQNLYSLQPPHLQKYADEVAGKNAPLYNCFDFVGGTIARICISVLHERVVYSHDTRVHGVKFRTAVFPNGLFINLEGQWEGRRHDCVLCFMNRVY